MFCALLEIYVFKIIIFDEFKQWNSSFPNLFIIWSVYDQSHSFGYVHSHLIGHDHSHPLGHDYSHSFSHDPFPPFRLTLSHLLGLIASFRLWPVCIFSVMTYSQTFNHGKFASLGFWYVHTSWITTHSTSYVTTRHSS